MVSGALLALLSLMFFLEPLGFSWVALTTACMLDFPGLFYFRCVREQYLVCWLCLVVQGSLSTRWHRTGSIMFTGPDGNLLCGWKPRLCSKKRKKGHFSHPRSCRLCRPLTFCRPCPQRAQWKTISHPSATLHEHLHRRFLVSQAHETHNCKGLHALPKGKINHVSKLISSISPNGLAYWSENYLSFFGYCTVLHLLCCFPLLRTARHDETVWYSLHVHPKMNQQENIRHAKKTLIIQTNCLHVRAQGCFELRPNPRNESVSDLIGSNVFMEEWTGDNKKYSNSWLTETAGFICFFISNTETPFLPYHPSRLLQIEETVEQVLPERFVWQWWILLQLLTLPFDPVSELSLRTCCLWKCRLQWWKWTTRCKWWKSYGTCSRSVTICCLNLRSFTQLSYSYTTFSFFF